MNPYHTAYTIILRLTLLALSVGTCLVHKCNLDNILEYNFLEKANCRELNLTGLKHDRDDVGCCGPCDHNPPWISFLL